MAVKLVYFIHKKGGGVARVQNTPENKATLAAYRSESCWREVTKKTYLQRRFDLCLV